MEIIFTWFVAISLTVIFFGMSYQACVIRRIEKLIRNTLTVKEGFAVEGKKVVVTTAPAKGATVTVNWDRKE